MKPCSIPECSRKHEARGYCASHYAQLRRGQELRPIKSPGVPNEISGHRWRLCGSGYVQGAPIGGGPQTMLHRLILDAPSGVEVDHWDGDPLNNRRANIRPVSRKQNRENQRVNARNTSGYRGVYWNKAAGKWQAYIGHNGKSTNLGIFDDVEAAAEAASAAREELFTNHRTREE